MLVSAVQWTVLLYNNLARNTFFRINIHIWGNCFLLFSAVFYNVYLFIDKLFINKYFTLDIHSVSLLKTNENEQKSTFKIGRVVYLTGASHVLLVLKSPPANVRDIRDIGLIPGSGRSTEGGHGNPLQYSCLENPHEQNSLVGYSP